MGWFWSKSRVIKDFKEVPKRRWNDTIEYKVLELNMEIDLLRERIKKGVSDDSKV